MKPLLTLLYSFCQILSTETYLKSGFNIHGVGFYEPQNQVTWRRFEARGKGTRDADCTGAQGIQVPPTGRFPV